MVATRCLRIRENQTHSMLDNMLSPPSGSVLLFLLKHQSRPRGLLPHIIALAPLTVKNHFGSQIEPFPLSFTVTALSRMFSLTSFLSF